MRYLSILLLFCFQKAIAQTVGDVSNPNHRIGQNPFFVVGGVPFVNEKYVAIVEGTPFFKGNGCRLF